jgi:hypothetical protein
MKSLFLYTLFYILLFVLLSSVSACSGVPGGASDNKTYTEDRVIEIARDFSPDCRDFIRTENETGSG